MSKEVKKVPYRAVVAKTTREFLLYEYGIFVRSSYSAKEASEWIITDGINLDSVEFLECEHENL